MRARGWLLDCRRRCGPLRTPTCRDRAHPRLTDGSARGQLRQPQRLKAWARCRGIAHDFTTSCRDPRLRRSSSTACPQTARALGRDEVPCGPSARESSDPLLVFRASRRGRTGCRSRRGAEDITSLRERTLSEDLPQRLVEALARSRGPTPASSSGAGNLWSTPATHAGGGPLAIAWPTTTPGESWRRLTVRQRARMVSFTRRAFEPSNTTKPKARARPGVPRST